MTRGAQISLGVLLAVLLVLCFGMAGLLGYGYVRHQQQQADIAGLTERLAAAEAARANATPDETLLAERELAENALAEALSRIALLEAELGRGDATDIDDGVGFAPDPERDPAEQVESMALEIRLLQRERNAARRQIDQLMQANASLQDEVAALSEQTHTPKADGGTDPAREEELVRLEDELAAARAELERRQAEIDRAAKEHAAALAALGTERDALERDLAAARARAAELEAGLSAANEALTSSNDEVLRLDRLVAEARAQARNLEAERTALREDKARIEAARDEAQAGLASAREKIAALADELVTARNEAARVAPLEEELAALRTQLAAASDEAAALRTAREQDRATMADLEAAASAAAEDAARQLAELSVKVERLTEERDQLAARLVELEMKEAELVAANHALRDQASAGEDLASASLENAEALARALARGDRLAGEVEALRRERAEIVVQGKSALDSARAAFDARIGELEAENARLKDEIASAGGRVVAVGGGKDDAGQDSTLRGDLVAARERIAELEAALESAQASVAKAVQPSAGGDDGALAARLAVAEERIRLLEEDLARSEAGRETLEALVVRRAPLPTPPAPR